MHQRIRQLAFMTVLTLSVSGCAIMHHTQISDVDSRVVQNGQRFEILVSQTGVNLDEVEGVAKAMTRHEGTQNQIEQVRAIIGLFQMGPRTGNPVFNDTYADNLARMVVAKCPNGVVSGLMSVREMAKYPVVSGEIIRLTGYCYSKT